MGMWTTENQDTLKIVLKAFGEASRKNYDGSYAFEAGYLESVIISMLPMMPKKAQKIVIEDMVRATKKQEQQVAEKMNKETI